ncbi:hypothetical protein NQ318_000366 [Aromia moschata]|uniref:RNA helicase n=1 Tax=Aromia moschata TaxID=1265417 RepID=A0AAV8YSI4_9CUCU|nr:hypothetical protein NQ318_000366 [Aromia moschata]
MMSTKQKKKEKPKIKKSRFNYVPKPIKNPISKIDPRCQEATPEILRIEIDQIFKEFLDDPESTEYIFPADLNNLQRKYIHAKAQEMNIISKSHGKEPNRKLHIRKRNKQLSNQSFIIAPCQASLIHLHEFFNLDKRVAYNPPYKRLRRKEKVIGKLVNGAPTLPAEIYLTKEIVAIRKNLPIYDKKDLVTETIRNNQVVIISSETGSGKTTQVPQYIMDDMKQLKRPCKIICTQPRRISTVAAAERVAYERGDTLGASVGYHIRLEQKYGLSTNLIYCTTGVFLRNLMVGSDALNNITHIIIDEVHERDKLSDFLLICLKQALVFFPRIRIILMSATVNTLKFLDYFGMGEILSIPGRLYPIDTIFLEEVLYLTKYMSPKMREAQRKEKESEGNVAEDVAAAVLREDNADMDEALDEYLNFSENYDYRVHYEEATAQLGMYFFSEGVSVDYQHSRSGRTALMIAASLGDKEFISRLCNMGANMDLCCKMGKTAFDYAYDNRDTLRLLEYIKSKSVNDNHDDDENKEAEHLLHLFDKTTPDDFIDYDLIVRLIAFIHNSNQEGSILVFLPGYDDIMVCNDKIEASQLAMGSYKTFFLHSSMNIRDQHEVFKHLQGIRKIILSTNIAETSITIDDVVFVIDTGKAKEKCYDSYNKVSSLQTHWISRACAKQRTGRAGRTRPGMCFRLYSKQRYENMDEERVPEILRVSLEELCLHTKVIAPEDMNIHSFLSMAPDPPSANAVNSAIENLQFLGALDKEEELTILGEYLAQLTIEPRLGKMLIYSVIFRCLEPILTLTAAMTHKDPFQLPPQANLKNKAADRRRELLDGVMSDHLLYIMVFKKWQDEAHNGRIGEFCRSYFVSHPTMNSILETRGQLLGQLRAAGFINQSHSIEEYNRNANCWPLVKAIICTGVYPNLAYPLNQHIATRSEKKVNIQNSSACSNKRVTTWLFYDEKNQTPQLSVDQRSHCCNYPYCLMCGIDNIRPTPNSTIIDEWIEFEYPDESAIYLRTSIEELIQRVLKYPSYSYSDYDYLLLQTLHRVLDIEEVYADLKPPLNIGDKPKFFFPQNDGPNRKARNRINPVRGGFVQALHFAKHNKQKGSRKTHYNSYNSMQRYRNSQYGSTSDNFSTEDDFQRVCTSVQNLNVSNLNPADRLLNGLIREQKEQTVPASSEGRDSTPTRFFQRTSAEEKFGDYVDEKIFILIKPKQRKNVEIAQQTSKWIFAPQTEKKILHFTSKGKAVYLLFTVNQSHAFQGTAQFLNIFSEASGKPTANVEWLYKLELEFNKIRQLRNPYNENRPIYEGLDGQVIEQNVAEELVRIYGEVKDASEKNKGFPEAAVPGCSGIK